MYLWQLSVERNPASWGTAEWPPWVRKGQVGPVFRAFNKATYVTRTLAGYLPHLLCASGVLRSVDWTYLCHSAPSPPCSLHLASLLLLRSTEAPTGLGVKMEKAHWSSRAMWLHVNGFVLPADLAWCLCVSIHSVRLCAGCVHTCRYISGESFSNSVAQSILKFPAKYLISFKCVLSSRFCDHWFLYPELSGILW